MKIRFLSLSLAVLLCLLTMTSCSAAEVPESSSTSNSEPTELSSETTPSPAFSDVPADAWYAEAITYCEDMAAPEKSIQACLDRLNIGYVDMMLLHHPDRNDVKAYRAMEKFVADGKIRSLGLSNWYVKELESFLPQVTITPALVQNEIHPYYQENEVIPYIQDLGIVVQGWYPLGGRGHTAELLGDEVISGIAKAHGVSSAQVILRWNLQKGG